jgi:tetratricopeptide (TPR) repeat protein
MKRLLLLLPAPLLLLATAHADGPTATSDLVEKLRQKKIERFFSRIDADQTLPAALKADVLKLREAGRLGGEFDCIHQSLLLMSPAYQRADALLQNERYGAAAEAFGALRQSEDEYLRAYATFRYAVAQMNRERYDEAGEGFTAILNEYRFTGCDVDAAFYNVVCLGQAREKEKAIAAANAFLKDYPDAPERYRAAMEQLKNELVQEWESPLYDLAGRMNHVAKKIEGGDTGNETQAKQKEIVSIIEELIKRAQQNEGQGSNGDNGGGGPPRGNQQPSSPASRSVAPPGSSRVGELRPNPRKKPQDAWGEMRDKEREEVLQSLKEQFPDRYRELLEQYNKALAEGKRVTEPADDR